MDDIYKSIEDYNLNKKCKMLITDMLGNKNLIQL